MDKTLYISDLDGTLLRRDKRMSTFTMDTINRLCAQGMLFSYATARSIHTAAKLTAGITANLPVVTYNGGMILDSRTGNILRLHTFSPQEARDIWTLFQNAGLWPLVYAYTGGRERMFYCPERLSPEAEAFLADRTGDRRLCPVSRPEELLSGETMYFNCVDSERRLRSLYEAVRGQYQCVFQQDVYCGGYLLELMPRESTKANGVLQLKELLGCTRIVAFGDGKNDIPMFEIADESYAVENADAELKALADGLIPSNEADGVARWLLEHVVLSKWLGP